MCWWRQQQTLMLPDGPVTVPRQHPHVPVDLSQQGDIAQTGLLGKRLAATHTGLGLGSAPAGSGPVPPVRRIVVVSHHGTGERGDVACLQ